MPHRVYLLRGNHESRYGFNKEVWTKYGDQGKHVYNKFLECFKELPVASVSGYEGPNVLLSDIFWSKPSKRNGFLKTAQFKCNLYVMI